MVLAIAAASAASCPAITVSAYASTMSVASNTVDDIDNLPIMLIPVAVPSVVVGGMVLKSRTKKPSKGDTRYISKLEFSENSDIPTGETTTTEPKASSVKRSPSRTDDTGLLSSGQTILAAITDSVTKEGNSNE